MLSWSERRKIIYLAGIAFFVLFAIIILAFFVFYQKPNCSDGKKNGDEIGVDCGGSCVEVCMENAIPIRENWVRAFEVKEGLYSVAVFLENLNNNFYIESIPYSFKIYDSENILVSEIKGEAYIPPGKNFAIFEGGINVGSREPSRVTFEWQGDFLWKKIGEKTGEVITRDISRESGPNGSKVIVEVENPWLYTVNDLAGFVLVYNRSGNVIAVSKTVIDSIAGSSRTDMVFSWPTPFSEEVGKVEVFHWYTVRKTF
jgi:hypothetical protein